MNGRRPASGNASIRCCWTSSASGTRSTGSERRWTHRRSPQKGANPTDRGKAGTKHCLIVDGQGIPLASLIVAANIHDTHFFEALIDAIKPIRRPRGRPRRRPKKLHADKAFDSRLNRLVLSIRGIQARIARKGIESTTKLGRHRWVVERTMAWLNQFRRLMVRYERRADIHHGFLHLACAPTCWNLLEREF